AIAYDGAINSEVPRIILVDTFGDEKIETIRLAQKLKNKLNSVRVDTPGSRRGDLSEIVREIRVELDNRGFNNVGIFVSGGLDEYFLPELNPWVNGYGIGTSLSNAPTINFSLDIVEIEGKLITKKGKIAGKKGIFECQRCAGRAVELSDTDEIKCQCGNKMEAVTKPIMKKGKITNKTENVEEIRNRVISRLRFLNV
ncbi:MAG: nicotinate phosphoribosyltransferase, partial [candidate division WOR-3 bacterium]